MSTPKRSVSNRKRSTTRRTAARVGQWVAQQDSTRRTRRGSSENEPVIDPPVLTDGGRDRPPASESDTEQKSDSSMLPRSDLPSPSERVSV